MATLVLVGFYSRSRALLRALCPQHLSVAVPSKLHSSAFVMNSRQASHTPNGLPLQLPTSALSRQMEFLIGRTQSRGR